MAQNVWAAGMAETSEATRPMMPVQAAAEILKHIEKMKRPQSSEDIRTKNIGDGLSIRCDRLGPVLRASCRTFPETYLVHIPFKTVVLQQRV